MRHANTSTKKESNAGFLVGFGFLITAGVFAMMSPSVEIPIIKKPAVNADQIIPGAFRVALTDPPMVNLGTYDQRCNDCHGLFQNTRIEGRALTQHTNIILDHGMNDRCLNCHDKSNREKLTIRGKDAIGYDQVQLLCAQCHGPIYRDWQKGSHGKTIGYWNTDLGKATKLNCSQCHDPHSPSYKPMVPLPGPNTLRMGDKSIDHEMINERNPLQRWRLIDGHGETTNQSNNAEIKGDHE